MKTSTRIKAISRYCLKAKDPCFSEQRSFLTVFEFAGYALVHGGKIRTFRDPEIKRSIVPLCEFLRIAAFEVTVDSAKSSSHKQLMQPFSYYFKGTADRKRALKIDETIYDGSVAHYNILPSFGEPDWSEQELEQIRALEKQVALHSERGYIIKLAEEKGRIDETLPAAIFF